MGTRMEMCARWADPNESCSPSLFRWLVQLSNPMQLTDLIYRIFSRSLVKNLDPMRSTLIACKIGPFWSPCPWRNWTCLLDVWKMHEDAFWLQPNFSHSATLVAGCYWNPLPHTVILVSSILRLFDYVWTMVEVPSLHVERLSFANFSGLWWCGIFQRSQQLCHGCLVSIWTRHCLIYDTWFFPWGKKHMNFIYHHNLSHMSSLKRPLWLFYEEDFTYLKHPNVLMDGSFVPLRQCWKISSSRFLFGLLQGFNITLMRPKWSRLSYLAPWRKNSELGLHGLSRHDLGLLRVLNSSFRLQGVVATRPFVQWSNQYFYPTYPCYPISKFPCSENYAKVLPRILAAPTTSHHLRGFWSQ